MTTESTPPEAGEFELTLFGPGYGESIVLHVGDGVWVIVDSCIDNDRAPRALRYLEGIGIDPAQAVALIVATHWHDDHIRGMGRLVDACSQAAFCCAAALCQKEFLSAVAAAELPVVVVDEVVAAFAQQGEVVNVGGPAAGEPFDVVGFGSLDR